MQRMIELGRRVVAQTKLRIFKGITKSALKIVSVFEPETKILRRGKAHKPTEYGQMVKVQEAEGGIVTDIGVVTEHDSKLLVRDQQAFSNAETPRSAPRSRLGRASRLSERPILHRRVV